MRGGFSNELADYSKLTDHFAFIDIAKGIGIAIVITSHVYPLLVKWSTPFFIPLFFILSGYCTQTIVDIKKKFVKLIIPYIVFTIVLLTVYHSFGIVDLVGAIYSRWCLYPLWSENNIFFLKSGNGPLWFLTSMFVSFCLYKIVQMSNKPLMILLCYLIITYLLSFCPILLPWSIDTSFLMAIFIYVGTIIRQESLIHKTKLLLEIALLFVYITLWLFCCNVNFSVRIYGNLLFLIPCSMIGSFLLIKISYYIRLLSISRLLGEIGRKSLPIFCLHFPFIALWRKIIVSMNITIPSYIDSILCVIFIIAITYPISLFVINCVLNPIFSLCGVNKVAVISHK